MIVDDELKEVCTNLPSTVSIIPTSIKLDSASTSVKIGRSKNARMTAIALLILRPKVT
jgi:hypothetical protein